jgi:hypothetical protein
MDSLSAERPPSRLAKPSAHSDNGLHSCAVADISPIMVALGKVIGRDFLPPLSSKRLANLPDDPFRMVACDPLPQSTFNGLSVRTGYSSPMNQLYFIMAYYYILFRECLQMRKRPAKLSHHGHNYCQSTLKERKTNSNLY